MFRIILNVLGWNIATLLCCLYHPLKAAPRRAREEYMQPNAKDGLTYPIRFNIAII